MITSRRQIWRCAIGAAVLPLVSQPFGSRSAAAPNYPARPVHLVVTVPAGGSPDIIGRLLGQWLSDRLAQPFVIENRPGASANIGTEFVVRAAPDGHTLLLAMSANAINASLLSEPELQFHPRHGPGRADRRYSARSGRHTLAAGENRPRIDRLRQSQSRQDQYGERGQGDAARCRRRAFQDDGRRRGRERDLSRRIAGDPGFAQRPDQIMFGVVPASLGYIKSGRLRALAVTTAARQEVLPDVPAMSEFLPGFAAVGWYGIAVPKNTPPEIVDFLNKEINDALHDPEIKKRLAELGVGPGGGSPSDFAAFIAAETERWSKVVSFAGTKAN